jgi:hypothetical protein
VQHADRIVLVIPDSRIWKKLHLSQGMCLKYQQRDQQTMDWLQILHPRLCLCADRRATQVPTLRQVVKRHMLRRHSAGWCTSYKWLVTFATSFTSLAT